MAILETIFCQIFEVIATFVKEVAVETFTNCIYFNDNMHTLEEHLQALTSKAFDIEQRVKREELSGKKKRTMEVENWLENVEKFKIKVEQLQEPQTCKYLLRGTHLKKLIEGVGELIKKSETFHDLVLDACETNRERLFTPKLHGEILKQELDNISAWLESKSNQVSIIGIYGMGGVGKTTLARHISNHICTNLQGSPNKFHVYWVTVSQELDINKLQNKLANNLNVDLSKYDDVEEKAAVLHQVLRERKNVVVILDDVWEYFDLEKIGILLGVDGCKVIITSRSLDVCKQMRCKETIKVQPLFEKEAWKLFLEKLDCDKLNPKVEEVAKKMVKKCAGLPLAIITVATSMTGVDDIDEWRNASEELKDSIMGQNDLKSEVLPILQYSYNRLRDPRLQQGFLYCSLYPEDHEIPRDELISLFISEGLMHHRDSRAAKFVQGHAQLNRLVKICLLESVVNWKGEKCVKMHDLLREMAVGITINNPRFMTKAGFQLHELPDEQEWTEDLDKVSLMLSNIYEIPKALSPRCPRLSTLILSGNPLIRSIPDSFFTHMQGLRVLDLRDTEIKMLPNSISELENLTALLLGDCFLLSYVPSLRKLKALMELDISGTEIQKVPDGIECLVKLKCLNMTDTRCLVGIPRGLLPRLSRLQRLLLPDHVKVESEEVESLKLLEEFEGWTDIDIFNSKWFSKSQPFIFYKIVAGDDKIDRKDLFLNGYERGIMINECTFKRGFKSGENVFSLPHNIQCLVFSKCKGLSSCLLEDVPSLYHSKGLQKCDIKECDEIESIMRISSTCNNNDGPLQNLEHLSLIKLPNLIGLIKWEPRALAALPPRATFSSLKELYINECHKMKKLFPHKLVVHNLQNLERIDVSNCDQMEEIIAVDENLALPPRGTFSSLKHLSIHKCPKVKKLFPQKLVVHNLQNLEVIEVIDCDQMEEIIANNEEEEEEDEGVDSTSTGNSFVFPKLKRIILSWLLKLDSICKGKIICCDSIEKILVTTCPKIKRLPFFNPTIDEKPTITFPKLVELSLLYLPEVKSICNGIMICYSITIVDVKGCTQLRQLPLFLPLVDGQPSRPPTLEQISIDEEEIEWWESLEWDHSNSINVLRPFFIDLERLRDFEQLW